MLDQSCIALYSRLDPIPSSELTQYLDMYLVFTRTLVIFNIIDQIREGTIFGCK
jgi:hypothetical protein